MNDIVIRARTPKGFDVSIHRVLKFKKDNYKSFHELNPDGYYQYRGVSAEASVHYAEGALLGLSNVEVVSYIFPR
jgi:hypothetical protein